MKTFYYIVRYELEDFYDIKETTGNKEITILIVQDNKIVPINNFTIVQEQDSEDEIREYLIETEEISEDEEINLIQL